MAAPLLIDLSHTSHTRARTGVQRVARSLRASLGKQAVPITHDPFSGGWRTLEPWETDNLASLAASPKRGAKWPVRAQISGRLRRWFGDSVPVSAEVPRNAAGLVVPEIFSPAVAAAMPSLFGEVAGPRVAVFHDAIALRLPELTPAKTVARFPAYLHELLRFDGIAAVSNDSRDALIDYWHWLSAANPPPVTAIGLGIDGLASATTDDVSHRRDAGTAAGRGPTILCLGSIEGRKNHATLLEACEQLWAAGKTFELHLVGLANAETGAAALARVRALQAAGRPLRYAGPVDDAAVSAAYAQCAFTVYPSIMEGFGLPVLESLAHGRPCICSSRSALGEAAHGGGCITVDDVSVGALAAAIGRLVNDSREIERLSADARRRKFRTWSDYAADLTAWMKTLPRRTGGVR